MLPELYSCRHEHSIYLIYIRSKEDPKVDLVWKSARRKTLVSWPASVDDRLDVLVRAATAAGESISRSQLLAALVAEASQEPDQLSSVIRRYRVTEAERFVAAHRRTGLPAIRRPGRRQQPGGLTEPSGGE
jgi:hypothetical protein